MEKVVVYFDFNGVTSEQYDKVWEDLKASGNGNPKGLIFHVGAPKPDNGWVVTDIWESREAFMEFANVLMPIISKQGFPNIQPQIYPVHNIYEKQQKGALV
jgi:hypothetical protein